MFTGIVTDVGEVLRVEERAEGLRRLTIACAYDHASIAIGASIACSGVCMTAGDGSCVRQLDVTLAQVRSERDVRDLTHRAERRNR